MLERFLARLRKRSKRSPQEEDAIRTQAELERRKAEAEMAEQQQRVGSHGSGGFPGAY